MKTEENITTENEDKQQSISYRYENAKDNEYHPTQYNNNVEVSESGADLMQKINEEADNLKSIIVKKDLKIFSKYEDLDEEQLKKLIEEKDNNLLKLNKQKDESKNKLSNILKKLNKTITDNSDILYKEKPDPEILFYLQKEIENKKKELKIAKNMNHSSKCQYNAMYSKLNKQNKSNEKGSGENKISNLKNENKKLQIDIRKYKDEDVNKKKDVKKIVDNKELPNTIKKKTEEIRNLTSHKNECYTKIKMSIKSLENIIKEISHLEEMSEKKYKEDKDENLNNKINYWLDIIKSDLNGTQDEIIAKIDKNETNFIKEINKLNKLELKNKNNTDDIKSSSLDEKTSNLELSYDLKSKNRKKNVLRINNSKDNYKGIFGKFNYLKQKQNQNSPQKYKLKKINISSEEIKNNKNIDIDIIIQKDYVDTTDNDYRILLDKKSQYLETNVRLERNIKEIERTKKSKLLNISYTIQENEKKLKELKLQNDLLEQEIINLQNLFQLTIDKVKIKKELKDKKNNKKIIIEENNNEKQITNQNKLETSLTTEKNILNELKESNEIKISLNEIPKKMNKNRSGYTDDFIPDKSVFETREQRLKKIKEKYLVEDENEEIKENKNNIEINEEIKENANIIEQNNNEIKENRDNTEQAKENNGQNIDNLENEEKNENLEKIEQNKNNIEQNNINGEENNVNEDENNINGDENNINEDENNIKKEKDNNEKIE